MIRSPRMDLHNINIGRWQGYNPRGGRPQNITGTAYSTVQSHFFNLHIKYASRAGRSLSLSLLLSKPVQRRRSIYMRIHDSFPGLGVCSFSCGRVHKLRRPALGTQPTLLMQLVKKSISVASDISIQSGPSCVRIIWWHDDPPKTKFSAN